VHVIVVGVPDGVGPAGVYTNTLDVQLCRAVPTFHAYVGVPLDSDPDGVAVAVNVTGEPTQTDAELGLTVTEMVSERAGAARPIMNAAPIIHTSAAAWRLLSRDKFGPIALRTLFGRVINRSIFNIRF
jgi:hypothetical protein